MSGTRTVVLEWNFIACIVGCDGKYCFDELVLCVLYWEPSCHHRPTQRLPTKKIVCTCIVEAFGKAEVGKCFRMCCFLAKTSFLLYREPNRAWSFERQVTVINVCAYMYR